MPDVGSLREHDPATVAGYSLLGRLGEGGQGTVFLGRDPAGRDVAVKVLHTRFTDDSGARARFVREISAARRVAGFSTARVLDADVAGEHPYIVTEYVDGPSLQRLIAERGPYSGGDLERLAVGTATALSAIHQAGIVHRDFKPGNVLLGPDGPRVIDFGIARVLDATATLTSQAVGTPAYMAPEQLSRGPIGPAVDVFAWGATMVFAATGSPPFGDDTVPAVIRRVLRAEPELAGVPGSLRGLLADCLAKDPAVRPAVRQVLDRMLGGENASATTHDRPVILSASTLADRTRPAGPMPGPGDATPPAGPYGPRYGPMDGPPPKPPGPARKRRRRWVVGVAAATVVAGGAGAGVWLLGDTPMNFTTLTTAGCAMVPAATVREVAAAPMSAPAAMNELQDKGPEIHASCRWSTPSGPAGPFRELSVYVSVLRDVPYPVDGDSPKGLDRAKAQQLHARRDSQGKAGHTRVNGTDQYAFTSRYGRVTQVSGLGDEGFVASEYVRNVSGSFGPEIAYVQARLGNALISAEYTTGERPSADVMTPTPEAEARRGAETVAREVLRYLSRCKACRVRTR
jgi:predicted Ser/Thr protein kinase